MRCRAPLVVLALTASAGLSAEGPSFDVVIRGGMVYDGEGGPARQADVGIVGDTVRAVGTLGKAEARTVIDATGLAVAPGFINVLSWSTESLIADGRSQGEIRQGVTTEVFGEGASMGPYTEAMKKHETEEQGDIKYDITWTTLAEYLAFLEKKGVSPNVASFIGAATVREHVMGLRSGAPSPEQMQAMRELVRQEMEAGALGIGSSLIYAPGTFASTEELIELCKEAAKYKGTYISHLRSEADRLVEAVDELIRISRETGIPAEIYHLKAAGEPNWPKMDAVIQKIEAARREGLKINADMYTYTAGSTGFDACVPPWARDGGYEALFGRLQDPPTRNRILEEMTAPPNGWENLCVAAGTPERILLVGFKNEALKPLTGEDAGRGGPDARHPSLEHRPRPDPRGPHAGGRRLLPHVRGQRAQAAEAALGVVRVRCGLDGARGRLPQVLDPSPARTGTSRAGSGSTSATRSWCRCRRPSGA
jgi:N-acyl-D-amino-acid deacylase